MPQDIELWTHEKSGRQFLIPNSLKLPPGEYQITNRERETIGVQKAHIKGFKAGEKEIEAFMQSEIQEALAQVGDVFKGLFDMGKKALGDMNIAEILQQFIDDDDDSEESSEESSWDSDLDESSDEDSDSEEDSDDDSEFPDNVFVFEGPSEDDSEDDSDFDLGDLGAEFDSVFKEFVEDLRAPFNELKQTVVGGMSDLQNAFGDLGEELKGAVNSEEGRNLLRELGQQLQKMADGAESDDSGESEEVPEEPDLSMVFDEDSVEVIEPEEWVEQLVEEIKVQATPEPESQAVQPEPATEAKKNAIDIPSKSALGRLKKSDLIALADRLGIEFDPKSTKAAIVSAIDAAR